MDHTYVLPIIRKVLDWNNQVARNFDHREKMEEQEGNVLKQRYVFHSLRKAPVYKDYQGFVKNWKNGDLQ